MHIKQYIMNTMTTIHAEHSLNMILGRSWQDMADFQDQKQDPQMWDLPVGFYIVVLTPEVPHPPNKE